MTEPTEQHKIYLAKQPLKGACIAKPEIESVIHLEQPNQKIMIVKTIQSLMTVVNDNLTKLDKLSMGSTNHKVLVRQAFEEIDLFQQTTLNDLQKAFE